MRRARSSSLLPPLSPSFSSLPPPHRPLSVSLSIVPPRPTFALLVFLQRLFVSLSHNLQPLPRSEGGTSRPAAVIRVFVGAPINRFTEQRPWTSSLASHGRHAIQGRVTDGGPFVSSHRAGSADGLSDGPRDALMQSATSPTRMRLAINRRLPEFFTATKVSLSDPQLEFIIISRAIACIIINSFVISRRCARKYVCALYTIFFIPYFCIYNIIASYLIA